MIPHEKNQATLRGAEWYIFLALVLCYTFTLPRWADWNVNSRFDLALAIVDRGTLTIDAYLPNTGDYAEFNGHAYSDKAPGTSFFAIPPYWVFKTFGGRALVEAIAPRVSNSALLATLDPNGRGLVPENLYVFSALTFTTFFVVALPAALLGVLLYRILRIWATQPRDALVLTLAYGLATPAFAYSNNLYSHQPVAFLLFAAFYLVFQTTQGVHPRLYAALTGLALGCSLITEYPTALIAGGIGLYALYKWRNLFQLALLGAAALPPLVLMAVYNYVIFGTPLPVGYLYSPLYTNLHHVGLISLTYPRPEFLWQLTFGVQRGLFLLAPFLLFAIPGFIWFAQERTRRAEFFLSLWSVISFFLFNASSVMWQGGFAIGPRYIVPMLPFLTLPIIFVLNRAQARWARFAIYALMLISGVLVWISALSGQEFPQFQAFPMVEYSLPHLVAGDIARNLGMLLNFKGLSSLIPLGIVLLLLTIIYRNTLRPQTPTPLAPPEPRAVLH